MIDEPFELLDARLERTALWKAACQRQISYARLVARIAELRKRWGDALYKRPSR